MRMPPWALATVAVVFALGARTTRAPQMEEDAALRDQIKHTLRSIETPAVNPYATLARPKPAEIEILDLYVGQSTFEDGLGHVAGRRDVGYRAWVRYRANGGPPNCHAFSARWLFQYSRWAVSYRTRDKGKCTPAW